jgi:hypothetical protein
MGFLVMGHFGSGMFCMCTGCHVKGPLPPLEDTPDTVTKSCTRQVKTRVDVTWQVLLFLPRVAGFPQPRLHWPGFMDFTAIIIKNIIVHGESPEAKHIENTIFLRIFLLRRFLSCKH